MFWRFKSKKLHTKMSVRLKSIHGTELTEYVIKLLNNNKIYTVIEFLEENSTKLSKCTNLTSTEITGLKIKLSREYCPSLICGINKYDKLIKSTPFITGIESLDSMLNGELIRNNLIEVCGLPASGKSFLCSTIALNLAQYLSLESITIDTKNDFSASRINKFLTSRGCSEQEIGVIMQKIFVERIYTASDIVKFLKKLEMSKEMLNKLNLIVIDSLPSVWFLYHGEKTVEGISTLVETTNLLRKISNEHGILVFVVNIVTRWVELELEENISEKSQTTIKPSLGKYWETAPSLRLLIEEISPNWKMSSSEASSSTSDVCQRFVKILKSNCYETGKCCTVNLTDKGIL